MKKTAKKKTPAPPDPFANWIDAGTMKIAPYLSATVVDIGSVAPNPANVKRHTRRSVSAIWNSLAKFGQRVPIAVNRGTGLVVAGNGRWLAAKAHGATKIAAAFFDDDESAATAFAIADNRVAELAPWNDEELAAAVARLSEATFDLGVLGYDPDEIAKILNPATDTSPDTAPSSGPSASKLSKSVSVNFTPEQYKTVAKAIRSLGDPKLSDSEAIVEIASRTLKGKP